MQTRRDHVQAYQFATARLAAALVSGDPTSGESPLRRSSLGATFGVLAAVLLCGLFAVYGLINPGGATAWRQPGSIIVEKETGNRYLFVGGTLYPTLNTASAMLFNPAGSSHAVLVSRNSLAGVPHGPAIGVPGAPDSIPQGADLLPGAWSLCARQDNAKPGMTVDLNQTAVTPVPAGQRVVVTGDVGADYVVWRDVAYRVGSPAALIGLGLTGVKPVPVTATWLAALRSGPTLAAPTIDGAGAPGPAIGGQASAIGQLLSTSVGGVTQYYVLRRDGIAPVSRTVFALLSAQPGQPPVRQVAPGDLAAVPASADVSTVNGLPDLVAAPTFQPGTAALCVRQNSSGTSVPPGTLVTEQIAVPDGSTKVAVPADKGLYAYSLPVDANRQPNLYLITDQGRAFPLSPQAASALQLNATPVGVPAQMLASMPAGPALQTGNPITTGAGGQ